MAVTSNMQDIEWHECLVPKTRNPELERELRQSGAIVTQADLYLLALPWLVRTDTFFYHGLLLLLHLDRTMGERIWMTVSQDQSCRYCYASMRAAMRFVGMAEEEIRRLEQDMFTTELAREERLVLEFARKISRANPLPTAADARPLLEAGYEAGAVREIASFAAVTVAGNRMSTLPALPHDFVEQLPDRWHLRLLRPLIGRRLRRKYRRGVPTTLTAEEEAGPYAYLVRSLRGLPLSRTLRNYLDDAWACTELTRRQRALIFAVIARGLGNDRAEAEAVRLLDDEGFSPTDARHVLAHLTSPRLDPIDVEIVRFARDTIRFQPIRIQSRAAELRAKLSLEQFLDVVGSASIANGVCRGDFVSEPF
jgi:hypothetical protein